MPSKVVLKSGAKACGKDRKELADENVRKKKLGTATKKIINTVSELPLYSTLIYLSIQSL